MYNILFLLSFALTVLCTLLDSHSLSNRDIKALWDVWMQKYQKNYETEQEAAYRYQIFKENYKTISDWNSVPNTAVLALNRFADLKNEEFAALYTDGVSSAILTHEATQIFDQDIPTSWDWRQHNAVAPIKNQSNCQASYLFATVASLESYYAINVGPLTPLSEQQILDCALEIKGCEGSFYDVSDVFDYAQAYGLEPESEYPYVGYAEGCSFNQSQAVGPLGTGFGYVASQSPSQLKAAVYQQPTTVVLETDQPVFQFYSKGVITNNCGPYINAVATVVGFGNYSGIDSFIVKNSWGTDWGVDGYVYISTDPSYGMGFGPCGILEVPIFPTQP